MQNYTWKPKSESPKTIDEVYSFLLNLRGLDTHLIHNRYSLKDILKKPKDLNITKEQVKSFSKIIKELISNEKQIVIHGDYDVDGITSTAIAYESLTSIGVKKQNIKTFIPNRFNHGYGFSEKSFEDILLSYPPKSSPLIILLDCGITSLSIIKRAKKEGYTVVVIDHHQKKKKTPDADIIFWNDKITASALTYFVFKYIEIDILGNTKLSRSVDLAGLGYICDMGDLSDPVGNILTKHSLDELNSNTRLGIKNLIGDKKIRSYEAGWVIGPRINASGRMEDASKSLELLLGSEDSSMIAMELNRMNEARQDETKQMYETAVTGISNRKFVGIDPNQKVIIVHSKDFHEGVIGLVSSKLTRAFNKPSICISWEGEMGKASCRSINQVSILNLLESVTDLLESFGGHSAAAGFVIKRKNYDQFEKKLIAEANERIDSGLLEPTLYYDFSIKKEFLNYDLLNFIDRLEPFGNGNPEPLFALKNVNLEDFRMLGASGSHISFKVKGLDIKSVYFGGGSVLQSLTTENSYDLLFNFSKNEWKGSVYPQLMIKDLKVSDF